MYEDFDAVRLGVWLFWLLVCAAFWTLLSILIVGLW